MDASLSDVRRRAIADIVQVVGEGEHWRAGFLMERFVVDADMAALFALCEAPSEASSLAPCNG